MELKKVVKILKKLETQYPVDSWEIHGVKIWPLIRFEILGKWVGKDIFQINTHIKPTIRDIINKVKTIYKPYVKDRKHNEKIHKSDVVILSRSIMRNSQMFSKYYHSRVPDTFKECLCTAGLDTILLEFDPEHTFYYPRHKPTKIIQHRIDIIKLIAKIRKKTIPVKTILPEYGKFISYIEEKITPELFSGLTIENMTYKSILLRKTANYFKRILKRIKPKFCFVTPWYIPECLAFCLACNELKIPSIDIQHGLIEGNIGYDFWFNASYRYKTIPSHFWVWGNNDSKVLEKWNDENVFIGGDLWLNKWLREDDHEIFEYESKKNIYDFENGKKNILLTLQPKSDPEIVFNMMEKYPNKEWRWWIRLHPTMTDHYPIITRLPKKIIEDNLSRVTYTSKTALPFLLKRMDLHITGYSSVIMEAEKFGLKTISYDPDIDMRFKQYVDSGNVIKVNTPKELHEMIIKTIKNNESKKRLSWTNPLITMKNFIQFLDDDKDFFFSKLSKVWK